MASAFEAEPGPLATIRRFLLALVIFGSVGFLAELSGKWTSARGLALIWQSVRGATPALAPGALVQLGLLGLIQAYRHPVCMGRS